jgi:hypothetical protein
MTTEADTDGRTSAGADAMADATARALPTDQATPDGRANRNGSARSGSGRAGRLASLARRHWLLALALAAGALLRLLALYAYRPAFEFSGDSYAYLTLARLRQPDPVRPAGYPLLLRLLAPTHALGVVPVAQHLTGLAVGVALYALLVHRRVPPPVAALAAAPVLLDAYEIAIEHFVMAETLFLALLVGALLALLWSPRPSVWACGAAGALLAAAGLVRTLGVALGVLALGYVLVRRIGWTRSATFAVALVVPLVGYAGWYHSYHGTYALSGGDAAWLYGRVAPIADCDRLHLVPAQRVLCPTQPPALRPGPNFYVWDRASPRFQLAGTAREQDALLTDFAHQVIRVQPVDYLRLVAADVGHYLLPGRSTDWRDWPVGSWRFPDGQEPRSYHVSEPLLDFDGGHPARVVVEPAARALRDYQRFGYTPGPLLAVLGVLGLGGIGLAVRRRRPADGDADAGTGATPDLGPSALVTAGPATARPATARPATRRARKAAGPGRGPGTVERRRIGADCALLVGAALVVLVVPSATVCFDYRYLLPVLVLVPPAAALAVRQVQLARRPGAARDTTS